jgi:dTDP-4-amino-4,6-dideoxygalactose transaminase
MSNYRIPFNKSFIVGKELFYIAQAVLSGHIAGDGMFTMKCQKLMENMLGAKKILLTNSCTSALEMAAILCEVGPGDEVIMPSFTFVSTANAFYIRGAKIIFVDIRPDTLNIDETKIKEVITDNTKVIVPVHYAGVSCNMDSVMEIAKNNNIDVVEDAAQGLYAKYHDKFLGTIGDIGTYSFHETKNYISGEGGAIVINNPIYIERAEIIREKGTNRKKFFRGEVDKYTWVDIGSSYLPSDIIAAFLYAQLENIEKINKRREDLYNYYYRGLIQLVNNGFIRLPFISRECKSNHHLFYILLNDVNTRDALMNYLKSKGILAVFHYIPLHLSKVGRTIGCDNRNLKVTERCSDCLLRLPFYYELTHEEQDEIIDNIKYFFESY